MKIKTLPNFNCLCDYFFAVLGQEDAVWVDEYVGENESKFVVTIVPLKEYIPGIDVTREDLKQGEETMFQFDTPDEAMKLVYGYMRGIY